MYETNAYTHCQMGDSTYAGQPGSKKGEFIIPGRTTAERSMGLISGMKTAKVVKLVYPLC